MDEKKKEVFQEIPKDSEEILTKGEDLVEKYSKPQPIPIQETEEKNNLSLILHPNFRDLELMIRGLQYVKRVNLLTKKEEVILEKIPGHPLNEYGINTIMADLKVYASPEIKLGRKNKEMYAHSVRHIGRSIIRLIYKNLKKFGMETQTQQRHAKRFCNAIIEIVDASYSRSIEGQENDASRPTEYVVNARMEEGQAFMPTYNRTTKENMKN